MHDLLGHNGHSNGRVPFEWDARVRERTSDLSQVDPSKVLRHIGISDFLRLCTRKSFEFRSKFEHNGVGGVEGTLEIATPRRKGVGKGPRRSLLSNPDPRKIYTGIERVFGRPSPVGTFRDPNSMQHHAHFHPCEREAANAMSSCALVTLH